jgi:hypothetical protein
MVSHCASYFQNQMSRRWLVFLLLCGSSVVVSAQIPGGVSPGLANRIVETGGRCPTFSWQEVPDAAGYEMVAYALPDGVEPATITSVELGPEAEVLYVSVPGAATTWTPALEQCLAPGGSYVWFVRGIFEDNNGGEIPGDWSDGLFFSVSGVSSAEEVEHALKVLRRYIGEGTTSVDENKKTADALSRTASRAAPTGSTSASKSAPTATTAIRGTNTEPTGEVYGVVGVVESPHGAGLAAANLRGGADLVLDGSSTGEVDLLLDQKFLDRPSPSDQVFIMHNSGAGMLNLQVEGVISGIGEGLVGVDAAALGGLLPHMWANKEGLITSGGIPVHWNNLADVPPDLVDGDQDTTYTAGPGLELDGSELSAVWPGTNWGRHISTTLDNAGHVGYFTSVTVGSDGLGLISYYDESNLDLKVAHCNDIVCSNATTTTIDSAGNVGRFTSITVGSDGLGLIAYSDDSNSHLKVAHCNDALCSDATTHSVDSGPVTDTSITVGPDGLGLISYLSIPSGGLKVAHCNNVVCSSATTAFIDGNSFVGADTSITIGSDRLGLISYYSTLGGDLKVAHCNDVACTSATKTTVDTADDVGFDSTITIGSDGLGLISYWDGSNQNLKVAHCSSVACSSATITTIDSAGTVGLETSITVGPDGLGLISYRRHDTGNLKVAHCNNITCSQASSTGVDSEGDVGVSTSITIGADGLPLISHQDWGNGDLKVTHCSNRFCIPHVRHR